jgi:hypothetical protein
MLRETRQRLSITVILAAVPWVLLPGVASAQSTASVGSNDNYSFRLSGAHWAQAEESHAQEEQGASSASNDVGQADAGASLEEINNQLNNPGASLASLNFKFTWNQFKGDLPGAGSQNSLALNFQPVFPFKLDDHGSNLMVRPSIPIVWQPHFAGGGGMFGGGGGFDEQFGIGDIQLVMFYANTNKETGFFWGAGPTMQFPTHTDDVLGNDAFQIGPAAYAGFMGKWGVVGLFPQHWWNIGGSDGYTAFTATQLFYWFSVGDGYQIGGAPTITYDWAADDSSNAWTVPVNLGVAKTVLVGKTPVKLKFEGMYYIEQPDAFGPHWGLQLTVTPVIPNPFQRQVARK